VRSRVELFERIRRDRRVEELSIRELAVRHGVHRRTVREALASAVPPPRKAYARRYRPAMDAWAEVVDGWLLADRAVPRKQRYTRRIWQRLLAEHGAGLSEVTVSRYVARRRGELGLDRVELMVPQAHLPGVEAQVDFGEFAAFIGVVLVTCWLFVMRLSNSGRAFHVAFTTQAQEAFLEGHVLAFAHFAGVSALIRYDNLKPAVARLLKGRDRVESERFVALRSHYGFDSFFCRPGEDGAHEKGGVEGEIGRFRRRHLVPLPRVGSLVELNDLIKGAIQTGLRVSELTGLNCGDVTLGAGANVTCEGKGRKQRAVPLTNPVQALLQRWLSERAGRSHDPLFPTRTGRRLSRDAVALRVSTHAATAAKRCPSLLGNMDVDDFGRGGGDSYP
jgi:transposase